MHTHISIPVRARNVRVLLLPWCASSPHCACAQVPRWDLTKFDKVSRQVGSAMQSVGEVMAIGRSFEESFQKALRMVEPTAYDGFQPHDTVWDPNVPRDELEDEIVRPTDRRVYALAKAFDLGCADRPYTRPRAIVAACFPFCHHAEAP